MTSVIEYWLGFIHIDKRFRTQEDTIANLSSPEMKRNEERELNRLLRQWHIFCLV